VMRGCQGQYCCQEPETYIELPIVAFKQNK
jgi:hypothetical protein